MTLGMWEFMLTLRNIEMANQRMHETARGVQKLLGAMQAASMSEVAGAENGDAQAMLMHRVAVLVKALEASQRTLASENDSNKLKVPLQELVNEVLRKGRETYATHTATFFEKKRNAVLEKKNELDKMVGTFVGATRWHSTLAKNASFAEVSALANDTIMKVDTRAFEALLAQVDEVWKEFRSAENVKQGSEVGDAASSMHITGDSTKDYKAFLCECFLMHQLISEKDKDKLRKAVQVQIKAIRKLGRREDTMLHPVACKRCWDSVSLAL